METSSPAVTWHNCPSDNYQLWRYRHMSSHNYDIMPSYPSGLYATQGAQYSSKRQQSLSDTTTKLCSKAAVSHQGYGAQLYQHHNMPMQPSQQHTKPQPYNIYMPACSAQPCKHGLRRSRTTIFSHGQCLQQKRCRDTYPSQWLLPWATWISKEKTYGRQRANDLPISTTPYPSTQCS
jgi:hypothetical protein